MTADTVQEERELLLRVLGTARSYIVDVLDADQRITAKSQEIEAYKKWGEERKTTKFYFHRGAIFAVLLCMCPVIFFMLMVTLCEVPGLRDSEIVSDTFGYLFLVGCVTAAVLFLIYIVIKQVQLSMIRQKINTFIVEWETTGKQKLDGLNAQLQELNTYRKELAQEKAAATLSLLPPKYTYLEAVDFFIDVIVNLRADSMKEAVNLYEEHLHRQRMEAAQNKLAEQQTRMLQMQQENQAILNSISQSAQSANLSAQRIESDVHTLETLAMIQYFKK